MGQGIAVRHAVYSVQVIARDDVHRVTETDGKEHGGQHDVHHRDLPAGETDDAHGHNNAQEYDQNGGQDCPDPIPEHKEEHALDDEAHCHELERLPGRNAVTFIVLHWRTGEVRLILRELGPLQDFFDGRRDQLSRILYIVRISFAFQNYSGDAAVRGNKNIDEIVEFQNLSFELVDGGLVVRNFLKARTGRDMIAFGTYVLG